MSDAFGDSGNYQVSAGKVAASAGTLTTNDGSASIADNGTGDFTITFGHAFLSAPFVTANIVDPTDSTDAAHSVAIAAVTATDVQFNVKTTVTNGTATDIVSALADVDFHYMAIGKRDR